MHTISLFPRAKSLSPAVNLRPALRRRCLAILPCLLLALQCLAQQTPPPVITGFFPRSGREGEVVTIMGSGFGQNANNLCVVIMDGGRSVPFQVLSVSPQQIRARLGPVAPDAEPGPIMLALGTGDVGFFKPLFPDITVREPAWVWVRTPHGPEAASQDTFTPIPTVPPAGPGFPQVRWFFSGPPTDGELCVFLDVNWPSPAKVRVQARVHDHEQGIGRDLDAYCIEFPAGGSLMDCAARICDTIRCAFMQQGMVSVNCRVELVAGSNRVKITISMPDGTIGWGNLNVCVETALPPPTPVITDFEPRQGGEGALITIKGTGFGNNPDNLCAVIMMPDNRSVPLEVLTSSATEMTARLATVPPDALPGQLMVGLGDGNVGTFRPAFADVRLLAPVWAWNKTGPAATAPGTFRPLPTPPSNTAIWYFSGPPTSDGKLCVIIDRPWPPFAKIQIQARAHDHQRNIGRDLRAICVEFGSPTITTSAGTVVDPPTALKCAYRICDVIVCAFHQQAGIAVGCTVDEISPGVVKITLSLPDGHISWGNLNVCVEPVPPMPPPVITVVDPPQGVAGDVITIRGTGFGNNPDNLCVVIMNDGKSIPLQAIKATDTEIQAVLGEVPPDARPGPIMVGLGQGAFGTFRPAFFDVFVADDVWTWNRTGGAALSPGQFRPLPRPVPIGTRWYHSGPPEDGVICLTLFNGQFIQPGDLWPQCSNIRIEARAHSHGLGIGRDLLALNLKFEGGGDLIGCAQRICDAITCAFWQQAGIVVNCEVVFIPPGTNTVIKIRLSLPEGTIDWGNLNVCVTKCPIVPTPVITDISPVQGTEGTVITINGRHFGNSPDNLCAVVMDGDVSIPLQVIAASDTQVRAVLGAVRPNAQPGKIMLGLGGGQQGTFRPALANTVVCEPVWVWNREGGPATTGPAFRPIPNQVNPTTVWFFSGPPTNGMLMVTIQGNWPSNALLRIEARAHDHRLGIGHDLRAICIRFPAGGTLQDCAARICDVIRCAFQQQAGIDINCQLTQISSSQIKLTLTFPNPNAHIDWGNFNVCVSSSIPTPAPIIISVTPLQAIAGQLVTVRGTNFPTDPNDVCMVHMGPPGTPGAAMSTPFEVISSSRTQIVARLSAVHPNAQPGPIMIGVGEGQMGTPQFAFFDVFAELPVWTWNKTGPAGQTAPTLSFRPIPAPNTADCPTWYFSGPPQNGVLCLFLRTDCPWPRPANIQIQARAHDHERGIGRDLSAISIRFEGGENTLECAYRICDVIRCAFRQQGGFEINCSVNLVPGPTGIPLVKITLSLPNGRIDWGNLNVCVTPIVTPDPVITNVAPLRLRAGEVLTIDGRGFGNNPDNVCAVIMSGNESLPLRVLTATDTRLTAEVGEVSPNFGSGMVMVGLGQGQTDFFTPAFPDIGQPMPTWTWVRTGGAAMGTQVVTPIPSQPNPTPLWFFSGPPSSDGKLCVFLQGNWPPNAKIQIQARAHNHEAKIGRDLRSICITLPGGGTTLDCAYRICDVIRCAFLQQAGIVVNCVVQDMNGVVKLTLGLPEGRIDWGNLNICVTPTQPTTTPPTITSVQPAQGIEGDVITIRGTGFGNNPNNVCAVVMNDDRSVPMEVLTTDDTTMTAKLGAVMPDAQPGKVMVGLGQGNMGRFRPAFFDVFVAEDVWTWNRQGGPAALSPGVFRPVPRPAPPYTQWFYGEKPSNGELCLFLKGNWPDPAKVRIEARLHDHNTGIGHDLRAVCVEWGSFSMNWTGAIHVIKMDLLSCAERICDTVVCAFWQQANIMVNCEIIPVDGETVKIVLSLPGGKVSWGNFNVCVAPVNNNPGPTLEIVRGTLSSAPTVILCWPRTQTGYCLQARTVLGGITGLDDWETPVVRLHATGTQLKTTVPIDRATRFFRLFREPPLLGNPD